MLGNSDDPGITPLAIKHVLRVANASKTREYLIRATYVEIYNDKIRDLMNPLDGDLAVREDKAGRVFVEADETIVESFEDAMNVLEKGQAARHIGETKMNARSSRSHTVFTLQIESKGGEGVDQSFRASSLNLVDLAGSERLKSTGAQGTRQKEGCHINKSLLVLGTIINRLSSAGGDSSKIGHLPYRDSKLTRLLRPALGGNAKTAVLCAVTPSKAHFEETISTLKFAERAKKITTNATRNEVVDYRSKYKEAAIELAMLKEQFSAMQAQMAELQGGKVPSDFDNTSEKSGNSSFTVISKQGQQGESNQFENGMNAANAIALSVELQASKDDVKYLKEHVDEVETENEHLRDQLRKKTLEFRGIRQRALELRSAARRAKGNERAVRRALAASYQKLEDAREQLDISRKKGSHVRIAEGYLEELSKSLKKWLPGSILEDLAESITPPASESQEDAENRNLPRESTASEASTASGEGKPSSSTGTESNSKGGISVLEEGDTLNGQRSVRSVRRKPRPLPEDMVADIDDSEAETDHTTIRLDDEDDDENLEDDEEFQYPSPRESPRPSTLRLSDEKRDASFVEKPNKKPKGWKAFKNFYGYGYTERGVYDKLIGGHKVSATAKHIST